MKNLNKRAISLMISYVLLVVLAVIISLSVYVYLRGFIPAEVPECPDGVSILVLDVQCVGDFNEGQKNIRLKIKNNGLFGVDGIDLKATDEPDKEIATVSLISGTYGEGYFPLPLDPNDATSGAIIIGETTLRKEIYSLDVTPVKIIQDSRGKDIAARCVNAKISEEIPAGDCHG